VDNAYDLTDMALAASDVEILDVSQDDASTELTITSDDVQSMVSDGQDSVLTIQADAGDTLVVELNPFAGETLVTNPDPVTPGADATYTIYVGTTQVAQIVWDVV
ncbi:MAG: hypothetical protein GWO23_08885, partial [Gammaproteobacteria bacterium]|nr:hypothetical protein [Gammaproteobacteria bacterium]